MNSKERMESDGSGQEFRKSSDEIECKNTVLFIVLIAYLFGGLITEHNRPTVDVGEFVLYCVIAVMLFMEAAVTAGMKEAEAELEEEE